MNVCVAVGGRFHAFDLAGQLEKRGHLSRLITSYPAWKAAEWGIAPGHVKSLLSHELILRGWSRMPSGLRSRWNPAQFVSERFDRLSARHIPEGTDIFVGFASMALESIRAAKAKGAITVLERGSGHILAQQEILESEYAAYGLSVQPTIPGLVERELMEYEEVDYISIPSTFVKRTFMERGIAESKLIVVPYGVDLSHFRPVPKADGVFRVIHCGAISLQKGVHYLLQAFCELDLPNAELWLIGSVEEEMKPFLERYAHSGVHLKGTYPQGELYKLYSQGSVFCLNSIQDGFGMVIAQAMACGLPVICSRNTAGEDIIREGQDGFVIPVRDVEVLKAKLRFFYDSPEARAQMGASALAHVQSGFAWDNYGEAMVAAYERVLAVRRQPTPVE